MKIETGGLTEEPQVLTGTVDPAYLELEDDLFFRALSPISYDLTACVVSSELLVTGSLSARLSCRCARCDEWTEAEFKVSDFSRCISLTMKNESVDLTDDLREDILLVLPMNFICSSSCSGLCPVCRSNLNKLKCDCGRPGGSLGWSLLDNLKPNG